MNLIKSVIFIYIILTLGCEGPEPQQSSFFTTLGNDTLVIEQFTMEQGTVNAEVLIRSPRTRYMRQILKFEEDGSFLQFRSTSHDPKNVDSKIIEEQTIIIDGDSLEITRKRDTINQTFKVLYDPSMIPWFDMIHWPYEVATTRMVENGSKESDQLMLTGRRPRIFEIRTLAKDSVSIKHPFRGTMYARINNEGGLEYYDATATTRKLIVKRGGAMDMASYAMKYSDKSIQSLSGAAETQSVVHGANIKVTFGQPARRGRELFGGIVPWNERWRTGANRATHFTSDKDLIMADLEIPAGEYTLFTIPAPDGGMLIINKQTGQNGRSYDEEQDLGRVPMTIVENDTSVELFTIEAVERGSSGVLQLKWGNTIFEVEFMVN